MNIGTLNKGLVSPVSKTAFFAAALDFPIYSPDEGENTEIPTSTSFLRIITRLAKPALETAVQVKIVRAIR